MFFAFGCTPPYSQDCVSLVSNTLQRCIQCILAKIEGGSSHKTKTLDRVVTLNELEVLLREEAGVYKHYLASKKELEKTKDSKAANDVGDFAKMGAEAQPESDGNGDEGVLCILALTALRTRLLSAQSRCFSLPNLCLPRYNLSGSSNREDAPQMHECMSIRM
jgi:hypothetical protein